MESFNNIFKLDAEFFEQCKSAQDNDKDQTQLEQLQSSVVEIDRQKSGPESASLHIDSNLISDPQQNTLYTCLLCGIGENNDHFSTLQEQREHFKSDWHKYNVMRKVKGLPRVTEDEFEELLNQNNDVDSISGSDTSSEDDNTIVQEREEKKSPIYMFKNKDQHLFWVYKAIIPRIPTISPSSSPNVSMTNDQKIAALKRLSSKGSRWAVFLNSGGHFAGAVYDLANCAHKKSQSDTNAWCKTILHKTEHKYVVRAKQGGRQSLKDATGKSIRSAGSLIRRHNEVSLYNGITNLVRAWADTLSTCHVIFYHANGINGKPLFAHADVLSRNDPRLVPIPFPTRRPTLAETLRVITHIAHVYKHPDPPTHSNEAAGSFAPSEMAASSAHLSLAHNEKTTSTARDQNAEVTCAEGDGLAQNKRGDGGASTHTPDVVPGDMEDVTRHGAPQVNGSLMSEAGSGGQHGGEGVVQGGGSTKKRKKKKKGKKTGPMPVGGALQEDEEEVGDGEGEGEREGGEAQGADDFDEKLAEAVQLVQMLNMQDAAKSRNKALKKAGKGKGKGKGAPEQKPEIDLAARRELLAKAAEDRMKKLKENAKSQQLY